MPPLHPARKWIALAVLGCIGSLAWLTMEPGKIRTAVLILLGAFVVRIFLTASTSR